MCVLQDTLGQLCCVVLPFPMASRELDCCALDSTEGRDVHSLPNPEPVEQFSPTSSSLSDSSSSESSSTSISRPVHTEAVWLTLPVDVSNILINAGLDRPEVLGFAFENEDELKAFIPCVDKNVLSQLWSEALRAADVGVRPMSCVNSSRLLLLLRRSP